MYWSLRFTYRLELDGKAASFRAWHKNEVAAETLQQSTRDV
jgi:hypothetical protein